MSLSDSFETYASLKIDEHSPKDLKKYYRELKIMKQLIIAIAGMLAVSCSTVKIEQQIVQDFVKEKNLKNIPYVNASYLIKDASSNENVLDIYTQAYLDKNLPLNKKRIDFLPATIKNWPLDADEIDALKSVYKKANEPFFWSTKNLGSFDIPIIEKEQLFSKIHDGTISISATGHIISKPILSLNKQYAILKYSSIFYTGGEPEQIYLMEKKDNKWTIVLTLVKNYDYDPS
ncbi:hypothetical protein SAMN05444397_101986 [Flavobacterium aquidurense]|uniref:Uncharacterized protein n=1 Tax=Flavobacterium frigidimaris TaxID=262320 RepID=A0ABX4BVB4_FLAFR|nr:hypothetical protein [Flavobacterium frigidimaris]OXA82007.1 hypothetical protein B0A65_01195 [Flavobacterium frigidimaris]SDY57677.1 hypothetical protein SAMN05444397_101986 [Flavobacterium aquidurense]